MPTAPVPTHRPPLSYAEAARYLGITPRHLRELAYRRAVPFTKVGRLVRFLPDDLDRFLEANRVAVAS